MADTETEYNVLDYVRVTERGREVGRLIEKANERSGD